MKRAAAAKPILLLHGNGEDHRIFDKLTPKLAKSCTVYAIDSRGHGKSDRVPCTTMKRWPRTLRLHPSLGWKSLDLRFRMGILGLLTALENPGLVGKLVLCGVNLNPEAIKPSARRMMKWSYRLRHDERVG